MIKKVRRLPARVRTLVESELLILDDENDGTWRGRAIECLRVLVIALEGLQKNQLFSRAAALSYSTLLGLGPLIAIVVLFSGSFLALDAELQIKRGLVFVAPQLSQYLVLSPDAVDTEAVATASQLDNLVTQIVQGARDTISAINTGGSTTFGIVGFLILLLIGIQLLTSIETTFNSIWGVKRGRGWGYRLVFYWTLISLGALLGLGGTALLSASTLLQMFNFLPMAEHLARLVVIGSPLISLFALTALLTFAYQFFPNTEVKFVPALIGAVLTTILLFINNYLSILYVHRVITLQSLYGSVGIIPVLMFGLYFFWVFILMGGQLTYAVQNAGVLTRRRAWEHVSRRTRDMLDLATLIAVARRFEQGGQPYSLTELVSELEVPGNLLNASVNSLIEAGWITTVQTEKENISEVRYQPAKPLHKITLLKFRNSMSELGNNEGKLKIFDKEPLVRQYHEQLQRALAEVFPGKTLEDLVKQDDR
ncbi:MAG: YihY/virulence factor BrkB family protein [Verrucomicrobia bacterium]|nr:YihY/virulence factor BrkB family protein [Verrucomicrobiota bacterium]